MPKKFAVYVFLACFSTYCHAQLSGTVTNTNEEPLPFVNIYLENTLVGTTTNDSGNYKLELPNTDEVVVVFKYLGFKTVKKTINPKTDGNELHVVLIEEGLALTEVELTADANPAIEIIQKTIANRKKIQEKKTNYTADFYSKGLIRIKNAPERILGMDLGDFGGGLDSTRSGIMYLSETISEIAQSKGDLKEKIVASKVSGDDNGFSFNAAMDVNFSLYENTVELGSQLVSPIADNAFSYYKYRLKGTFYDDGNKLINQIEVTPKRPQDKTFSGTIYIVEDEWALYAIDLKITGKQAQIVPVDTLRLKQNFNYSKKYDTWLKVLQSLDFEYNMLGFKGDGRFTAGYKSYNLDPNFERGDFNSEILSFEQNANKKDSLFWQAKRPVPLTREESGDYVLKDSIQIVRKTEKYLDSVDAKGNKPKLSSLLFGYTHSNTFKKKYITINSLLENTHFNTVQGWHTAIGVRYFKQFREDESQALRITANLSYGFADKRFRPTGSFYYRFNKFSWPTIQFNVGNEVNQFNTDEPISLIGNDITTLFFEQNYAKFYDRTFAEFKHTREISNGVQANVTFGFEDRKPLFNQTDFTYIDYDDEQYTSNNPLEPENFGSAVIEDHTIAKINVDFRIRFRQQYQSYPDEKFNIPNENYPTLFLGYEKGFASSAASNHFDQLKVRLTQSIDVRDKGKFSYNFRAGTFINADGISFVDYQHFNGNEARITRKNYIESFLLLPYYSFSTNKQYMEGHLEHNFNGFIMNRIPLLKFLNAHLIVNGNFLITSDNKPFTEFGIALGNLGIKKFRFLRVGYAQSYFNGITERGLNVGLQF